MKIVITLLSALTLMLSAVSVNAAPKAHTYSAVINSDGKVESQSASWIKNIDYSNQKDYAASYKVELVPGVFQKEPAYCQVSAFGNSSYEQTFHGIAKLSSKPTRDEVNVIGLMLGLDKPSGDSSMSFYLVCGK